MTDEPGGNSQDLFECRGLIGLSEALPAEKERRWAVAEVTDDYCEPARNAASVS